MSIHKDPYNPNYDVWSECGENATPTSPEQETEGLNPTDRAFLEHRSSRQPDADTTVTRALESSVLRGIFRTDIARRAFLKQVGSAAAAALVGSFFPLQNLRAMAEDARKNIEKKSLKIGFVPITCATPLVAGHALGFYKKYGLDVEVIKTAGWAVARDKCLNGEYDGSHLLFPMPAAMSMGLGSTSQPWRVVTNVNTNGQAIVLANKHKDKMDPKQWKGMKFAVPFEYSMHNLLLRMYVAEAGLDPDRDIQIRSVPPPEMVANLRADNVDGYLAPDPFCQRAVYDGVGFIYKLTRDIWNQHPCCVFSMSEKFIQENPNTFVVLSTAILEATATAELPDQRVAFADAMAPANYLNQPPEVLRQILTGIYPDGLGNIKRVPDRISFMPFPTQSMGIWVLSQMKRWGYIKEDVDYRSVASQIFLSADTGKRMRELAEANPTIQWKDLTSEDYPIYQIYGKSFNPLEAQAYVDGFAIKRS
jgi:nitrate/nitrite transport system substrate-binding protein